MLIVAHADQRGVQHQTRRLLGSALARGGHLALGPTSQSYIEIVYPPERSYSIHIFRKPTLLQWVSRIRALAPSGIAAIEASDSDDSHVSSR
jgi:hypothetical protein